MFKETSSDVTFNCQFAQTFGLDDFLTLVFHCSVHTHTQITPGSYIVAPIYKKGHRFVTTAAACLCPGALEQLWIEAPARHPDFLQTIIS